MLKRKGDASLVVERRLWHGTTDAAIENICSNNFNRSYCGQNGRKSVAFVCREFTQIIVYLSMMLRSSTVAYITNQGESSFLWLLLKIQTSIRATANKLLNLLCIVCLYIFLL